MMQKEECEKVNDKTMNRQTFDPIYFALDEYRDFYDFRRPDVEYLGDPKMENAETALKKKNSTFRNWLTGYYASTGSLPKRAEFEDAIDKFIDENYLIGSKLKKQMEEIDQIVDQIEIGVEATEELLNENLTAGDELVDKEASCSNSGDAPPEVEPTTPPPPKQLAPFIHKKYMKDDGLLPLPWMTKKVQAYPFLPPNYRYIVRHVFGLSLEDTICRCIWFENDCDLAFKLRDEYSYLQKIDEWRQTYNSEELDLLLNHNTRLDDQVPVIDLSVNPKLDLDKFDFNEFEKRTTANRLKVQEQIRTQPKQIKDCSRKIPELGRRQSKSFIKGFIRTHSSKSFFFNFTIENLIYLHSSSIVFHIIHSDGIHSLSLSHSSLKHFKKI